IIISFVLAFTSFVLERIHLNKQSNRDARTGSLNPGAVAQIENCPDARQRSGLGHFALTYRIRGGPTVLLLEGPINEAEDTHFAPWPVSLYGIVLLLVGCAYFILSRLLIAHHGPDSSLATALGRDVKARTSLALYVVAIALSLISSWIAWGLYVAVAIVWLIPDRRIERAVGPGSD